jgi:hypothetical protein
MPSVLLDLFHSLFGHPLNLAILIAVIILVVVNIVPRSSSDLCVVKITGESVLIHNCPDSSEIVKNINLAPWNGVKFPEF